MTRAKMSAEQKVKGTVRGVLWFLLACVMVWPGDWMVWRIRVAAGGGMGSVTVSQMTSAPLKGNKDEYYFDGMENVDCTQSIFGWTGGGACWWLRRYPEVITQY